MTIEADWIAVDWGTSNVRAWALGGDGSVLAEASSDHGMGRMAGRDYEAALLSLIRGWLGGGKTPVMLCGMAGARTGWMEAPYRAVPCAPPVGETMGVPTNDTRLDVRLIPGVMQASPADVMRGEETQIAGYLAGHQDFDGVLCLPGTHTKWAHISAGEIVSFRTFMTGDMFAALTQHTILSATLAGVTGSDEAAFDDAVGEAISRPEAMAATLFNIRAEAILNHQPGETGAARLSGLLIGAELAASRPYWLGQAVAIIGADALSGRYARALADQGVTADIAPARDMTLAGLAAARAAERTTP